MPAASTMDAGASEAFVECQLEPVKLSYRTANSLRQAYGTLLASSVFDNTSTIAKTKLQVLCASICRAVCAPYAVEFLQRHQDGEDSLSYNDFVSYIESEILPKGTRAVDDSLLSSIDKIAWTISMSTKKDEKHQLMHDDMFHVWQVFIVIDIAGELAIDKEEVACVYEEFMKATGTPWMPAKLEEYCVFRRQMTFQDVIDCLENNYLTNLPKSLHKEGINALLSHYVDQRMKTGILVKKGHRIKSMKERWFVLKPTVLMYFTNKQVKEKKGSITLDSSAKVECGQESKATKCRFTVTCGTSGTQYEIEAPNQRVRNEWVAAISLCIECRAKEGPLFASLSERKKKRDAQFKQLELEKEERCQQEQLILSQLEELERLRIARQQAEAHAEEESALLEEERKRREALEKLKAEYELLLEEERSAREDELRMRELQQTILNEEKQKREDLEEIKRKQEELLELERHRREGLEEESKEREKLLEDERKKMKELDKARLAAEESVRLAHAKLEAAEGERRKAAEAVEAAKQKARNIKVPVGLARQIQGGNKGITTHRGQGAFVDADFMIHIHSDVDANDKSSENPKPAASGEIVHTPLVKPSRARQTFEGAGEDVNKPASRVGVTEGKLHKTLSCDSDETLGSRDNVVDSAGGVLDNDKPVPEQMNEEKHEAPPRLAPDGEETAENEETDGDAASNAAQDTVSNATEQSNADSLQKLNEQPVQVTSTTKEELDCPLDDAVKQADGNDQE